jgi:hypothetical protein
MAIRQIVSAVQNKYKKNTNVIGLAVSFLSTVEFAFTGLFFSISLICLQVKNFNSDNLNSKLHAKC